MAFGLRQLVAAFLFVAQPLSKPCGPPEIKAALPQTRAVTSHRSPNISRRAARSYQAPTFSQQPFGREESDDGKNEQPGIETGVAQPPLHLYFDL